MNMTEEEYHSYTNDFAGYCTSCKDVTNHSGVEGDAEGYECEECGESTVMGVEQALLMGHISITGRAA